MKKKKKNNIITLSNGRRARLVDCGGSKFKNILIVEVDGVLRVVDVKTKTLAKSTLNSHTNNRNS